MTATWISDLKDPVLKADFRSFAEAGPITQAELAKAFGDLVAQNSESGANLSASQFADLKSIAKNIRWMGASPYLEFITNAFVNGDAANAFWTGGGSTAQTLGDLAAGFTPTDLGELVGKWFAGTDLPVDSLPGTVEHFKYSAVDAPLYGPDGPKMSDINQGILGDCFFLAPLAEVAKYHRSAITSMITDNGDGTYGVRFYVDGVARYVTVDNELPAGGTIFNRDEDGVWASLVETAFAEVQAQGNITNPDDHYDRNTYAAINGGDPTYTLEAITDATQITDFYAHRKEATWEATTYNQSLKDTGHTDDLSTGSVLSTIAADLLVGDDVTLTSNTNAWVDGKQTLINDHVLSVYGYDASTEMLEIRNPWGAPFPGDGGANQTYDTTFEVSLQTLLSDVDAITTDNMGKKTSVSDASVVAAAALQAMDQVTSFSVDDSVADIDAGLSGLIADSKLSAVTATGGTGADTLDLTGLSAAATIDMDGNSDTAKLRAHSLDLGSGYDSAILGSGAATIDYSFSDGGVEYVSNFSAAHDLLSLSLNGGALEQTFVDRGVWMSTTTDPSNGVFLADVRSTHVTVSHGVATVA